MSDNSNKSFTSLPILDHFVILVSHHDLLQISQRVDGHFTLAPGGNHADGLTTNKLILLQDGTYLELIAFFDDADPEKRRNHRWGNETEGTIIDWALTLPSESDFETIQKRFQSAKLDASYTDPIPGGRTKPDGTVLEWAVCTPRDNEDQPITPGQMPFWCLDRTPRDRRVPYRVEPHLSEHPSGVRGVSSVQVQMSQQDLRNMERVYNVIFDGPARYQVPSGSTCAEHEVSLSQGEKSINLVLYGSQPGKVELLPGLSLEIKAVANK